MVIGNWDGGPGERILVRVKSKEQLRRERARMIVDALREAGLDCDLHISDDAREK